MILDNARELLAAAGFSFADVVAARVFISAAGDFAAMNDVYREAFAGMAPPARATVVAGLMQPALRVEITFVAVRDAGRVAVGPSGPLPFSPAIAAGGRLFLAGVLGNSAGARVDTTTQTREIVARVGQTLAQARLLLERRARGVDLRDRARARRDRARRAGAGAARRAARRRRRPVGARRARRHRRDHGHRREERRPSVIGRAAAIAAVAASAAVSARPGVRR